MVKQFERKKICNMLDVVIHNVFDEVTCNLFVVFENLPFNQNYILKKSLYVRT